MKRNLLLTTLFVLAFAGLNAQTDGSGMILRVTIDGVNSDYLSGVCGFSTAAWGGSVTDEFCAPAAWGYSGPGDSLGCNPIPAGALTGKVAMIRRATCEFGAKALAAENAGAIAVMIANGTASTHGDDCAVPAMGAGAVGASVTIPAILICRTVVNQIDNAIKAGKAVTVCFLLPRSSQPFAGFHYATPVTQVAELNTLGFNFNNRGNTDLTDMVAKVEITEPGGNVTTISSPVPTLAPGTDTLLFISGYTPPAVTGEFNVLFTNNKYTESRDSLRRKFIQTDYTYASDNLTLQLDGGAQRNDLFATDLLYQVGSLTAAGAGGKGTYCTFGIANIDSIYLPGNPTANTLTVFLYKADSDGNGLLDFDTDFNDMEIAGYGTYELTGNEKQDGLVDAAINDFATGDPGATLEPGQLYFVSVQYDGQANGSGRNVGFTNSAYVPYLFFSNEANASVASTPIKLGGTRSYWGDRTVVCRLEMEGYVPPTVSVQPNILDKSKFAVSPNPASDKVLVDLNLAKESSMVVATIFNPMGQKLSSQVLKNFKNGQINLDVNNVPSGVYMLSIRTDEGVGAQKVMICH